MHLGSGRNEAERQRISRQDIGAFTGLHRHADLKTHRVQDVTLLTIGVVQQRQACRAVGIVFDRRDSRGNAFFLAPEIHRAILLLVPSAAMPDGQLAVRIPPTGAFLWLKQCLFRRLLGDFALIQNGNKTPGTGIGIKAFQWHRSLPSCGPRNPRGTPCTLAE